MCRKRARGFCDAAAEAGTDFAAHDVLYGEWSERWGREAVRVVLDSTPDVDAIFCGSDQIARGVTDAPRLTSKRVPEDIAVVGYDNWSPMALGSDPPLTSVDMCLEHVGRVAAEHLMLAINGEPTHGVHTVPCRLIARGTTARSPLPRNDGHPAQAPPSVHTRGPRTGRCAPRFITPS